MIAPISENGFRLFRDYIHQECGLYFADNRRAFLSLLVDDGARPGDGP